MTSDPAADPQRFNEEMREEWRAAVPWWTRFDAQWSSFTQPLTEPLAAAAGIVPGVRVLDLASGSGDPALELAEIVGQQGSVTATDALPEMLAAARSRAHERGLTNMTFAAATLEALPFADATFEAVTCRFGLMFTADPLKALAEMRRVLAPSRRAALIVWGEHDRNAYWTATADVLRTALGLRFTADDELACRFAREGCLAELMTAAGFREVVERAIPLTLTWPGPAEDLVEQELEDAEIRSALDRLPPAGRDEVREAMLAAYRRYADGDRVALPSEIVLARGAR